MEREITKIYLQNQGIFLKTLKDFLESHKGEKAFLEHEVKGLLRGIGFPVPRGIFYGGNQFISPLPGLAFPLVAKVSSSQIVSKSDVRGVRVDIRSDDELRAVAPELSAIAHAEGILVEEMSPAGVEVIVGGIIDDQFGPVVMFGLGGASVELFKDVAFALAPVTKDDALWLIRQIKGYPLLTGFRGRPSVDMEALLNIVTTVSEIIGTGLINEIDLNPVALYHTGAMVLDAKMSA
ncbi:MAG: acetate--CoA ligase family protein [Dissulfurispiraceae bacterium]